MAQLNRRELGEICIGDRVRRGANWSMLVVNAFGCYEWRIMDAYE